MQYHHNTPCNPSSEVGNTPNPVAVLTVDVSSVRLDTQLKLHQWLSSRIGSQSPQKHRGRQIQVIACLFGVEHSVEAAPVTELNSRHIKAIVCSFGHIVEAAPVEIIDSPPSPDIISMSKPSLVRLDTLLKLHQWPSSFIVRLGHPVEAAPMDELIHSNKTLYNAEQPSSHVCVSSNTLPNDSNIPYNDLLTAQSGISIALLSRTVASKPHISILNVCSYNNIRPLLTNSPFKRSTRALTTSLIQQCRSGRRKRFGELEVKRPAGEVKAMNGRRQDV
ncbi:hypothetical protein C8Q75DRAFT_729378 [Abortiporus biennis]|nr:hypothetical protein C8Q75DRAFT_729378 [Abortiporus biennis]